MDEQKTKPIARHPRDARPGEDPHVESPRAPRTKARVPLPHARTAHANTPRSTAAKQIAVNPMVASQVAVNASSDGVAAAVPMSPGSESGFAPPILEESPEWRVWLAGGSSREVLARIVHEDPLGVRHHVARALRDGAWLLDADRVVLRCFALVARHALRYRGRPPVHEWVDSLAHEAIAALVREDGDGERRPTAEEGADARLPGAAFLALARPLGLEPEALGRACAGFNRLPHADRATFFALVIAGRTLDEMTRESGEPAGEIARRARRALDVLLSAEPSRAESASDSGRVATSTTPARRAPPRTLEDADARGANEVPS